jgi:hypothetical protein
VLYVRRGEQVRIVPPEGEKSVVRDAEELEALGGARIAEMIKAGQAKALSLVEGALHTVAPTSTESEAEHEQAQATASESAATSAAVEKSAKGAKNAGAPQANAPVAPLGTLPPETSRASGLSSGEGAGPRADGR